MLLNAYPNNSLKIRNSNYLYFGGTDYLSLQNNKEFISIVSKNIAKWGISYGSSRNANIKLSIYTDFEKYFADYLGFESVVSVSSCTLASLIIKDIVDFSQTKAFHINTSHPSIIYDDSQPVFVKDKINSELLTNKVEDIIISTDAILTSQITPTNFDFLDKINPSKRITLLIDESHSLGIIGKNGNGIASIIVHPIIKRKIVISSFSKALGVSGGIIASDKSFIEGIKNNKLFIGAAGVNPAFLQSLIDAKDLRKNQLNKLKQNILYFSKNLSTDKVSFSNNYPVCYYLENFQALFLDNQIITTNFVYGDYSVNRIVIKADHTKEEIDQVLSVLNK